MRFGQPIPEAFVDAGSMNGLAFPVIISAAGFWAPKVDRSRLLEQFRRLR